MTWKADQYSLGITAWELLAGERPYTAPTLEAMLFQHVHEPLPSLEARRAGLSRHTVAIIERMAAKKPSDRFGSYDDVIAALDTARREIDGTSPRKMQEHA